MASLEEWVWERLLAEQARLAPVPETAASASPPRDERRRVPERLRGRRLLLALVLISVPGAVGGLALASALEGRRISPQQWVEGKRVAAERAIPPEQDVRLAVLRRPRTAQDALPPAEAFSATHSPMAANGVNPQLSRRAEGFEGGGAWLIPGNGMVCLTTANAAAIQAGEESMPPGASAPRGVVHVRGALGVTGCATDGEANAGWAAGTASSSQAPGVIATGGIVPDGVGEVTVALAGGRTVSLPVHENVYMGEVHGWPVSVSFQGEHGPVTIGNGPPAAAFLRGARRRRRSPQAGAPNK